MVDREFIGKYTEHLDFFVILYFSCIEFAANLLVPAQLLEMESALLTLSVLLAAQLENCARFKQS